MGLILAFKWANRWRGYSFTCLSFMDEWVCTLKTAYPFIKHIPVVIVMSMSYFSNCAGMCRAGKATRFHLFYSVCYAFSGFGTERKTACYDHWAAPSGAITGNRHNDTPVQSQPHAMRTVHENHARAHNRSRGAGTLPAVWWLPMKAGVSRTNRLLLYRQSARRLLTDLT